MLDNAMPANKTDALGQKTSSHKFRGFGSQKRGEASKASKVHFAVLLSSRDRRVKIGRNFPGKTEVGILWVFGVLGCVFPIDFFDVSKINVVRKSKCSKLMVCKTTMQNCMIQNV
jgi:hypothetical protein